MLRFIRFSSTVSASATGAGKASITIKSAAPAGTVLKGCNIRKSGQDPVALADEEYPAWLWTVLDKEAQKESLKANPQLAARKERRAANRKGIKDANFLAAMTK